MLPARPVLSEPAVLRVSVLLSRVLPEALPAVAVLRVWALPFWVLPVAEPVPRVLVSLLSVLSVARLYLVVPVVLQASVLPFWTLPAVALVLRVSALLSRAPPAVAPVFYLPQMSRLFPGFAASLSPPRPRASFSAQAGCP